MQRFKDIHNGKRIWVLGAGSSLNNIDFNIIPKEDIIIACNCAVLKQTRFDYACFTDGLVPFFKYYQNLSSHPCTIISFNEDEHPRINDRMIFIKKSYSRHFSKNECVFSKQDKEVSFGRDITHCATHLAWMMGAKEIVICGVDYYVDGDYHWISEHELEAMLLPTTHVYKVDLNYSFGDEINYWAQIFRSNPGLNVKVCSPKSKIPLFPKINQKDIFKMDYRSQNNEAEIAIKYFGKYKGALLDIGANDGITFSNSYDLIKLGWEAHCFEPSSVCADLFDLHKGNPKVRIYNKGIGQETEIVEFFESGAHVPNGTDKALVSSAHYSATKKWEKAGVKFEKKEVEMVKWSEWYEYHGKPKIDLVSLDVEGMEYEILKQMNLPEMGTKMLIIEFNGNKMLSRLFTDLCNRDGLREISRNAENIIYAL